MKKETTVSTLWSRAEQSLISRFGPLGLAYCLVWPCQAESTSLPPREPAKNSRKTPLIGRAIKRVAYFDTNVFDNILKKSGGVTSDDTKCLEFLVGAGELCVLPSIINIQGTLGARQSRRPEIVLPQLRLNLGHDRLGSVR
jgi:hypothetical protein